MEIYIPKYFIYGFVALAIYILGVIVGSIEGKQLMYYKVRADRCICIEQVKGE